MKTIFSTSWKGSRKPSKQKKYMANAPLHIKQKLVSSHLSRELRKKFSKRGIPLRKGDKVKVMRGNFKKQEGKVERIELKNTRVMVSGIEYTKKDGTKKMRAFHPSNLMITELNLDDKLRQKSLEK
ncbi:50S ribosomal protein L24 [Candidatus Woesearchaeota archaeon]|nr:50S ribosomal protein L24 [Candidatus Woesearchaeota archaeon]